MEMPTINTNFVEEWNQRYYRENGDAKRDENDYNQCIHLVNKDKEKGTISLDTLKQIFDWKVHPRQLLKKYIEEDLWQKVYEPRFHLILNSQLPENLYLPLLVLKKDDFARKLDEEANIELRSLLESFEGKAKGFGVPVSSTLLHFIEPEKFPIIDVRTLEVLYFTRNTKFINKDDPQEYELFRSAILTIKKQTECDLHKIDRALFCFHDKELQKEIKNTYRTYSFKLNPNLKKAEIGNDPNIGADPHFRRLLIDIIKWKAKGGQSVKSIEGLRNRRNESDAAWKPVTVTGTIVEPSTDRWEIAIPKTQRSALPYRKEEYPIEIKLVIEQEYDGLLRFVPSQDSAYICAPIEHKRVKCKLIDTLKSAGFHRGHIKLQATGRRLTVCKQLDLSI